MANHLLSAIARVPAILSRIFSIVAGLDLSGTVDCQAAVNAGATRFFMALSGCYIVIDPGIAVYLV